MAKAQVRIPKKLFRRAKEVAAEKELSFAEIVRCGLEYVIQTNPPSCKLGKDWKLPLPQRLGKFLTPESEWD